MAVRSTIITVGTDPTPLTTGDDTDTNVSHRDVAVTNLGDAPVYLGGPDVTTNDGFPVAAGAGLALDAVMPDSILYAIADTDSVDVAVLEVGV